MENEIVQTAQNIETLVVTVPMILGFLAGTFGIGVVVWGGIQWVNKRTIEQQNAPIVNTLTEIVGKMKTHDETLIGVVSTMERVESSLSDKIQTVDKNNKLLFEMHQKSVADQFNGIIRELEEGNEQDKRTLQFIREVNTEQKEHGKRIAVNEKNVAVLGQKIKNGSST